MQLWQIKTKHLCVLSCTIYLYKSWLHELDSRGEHRHLSNTLGFQIKSSDPQNFLKFPQKKSPRRLSFCMRNEQKCLSPKSTQQFGVYSTSKPTDGPRQGFLPPALSSRADVSNISWGCLISDESQPGEVFCPLIPAFLISVISRNIISIRSVSLGCKIKWPFKFCSPCDHLNHQVAPSWSVLQKHIRGTPQPSYTTTDLQGYGEESDSFSPSWLWRGERVLIL